MAEIERQKPCEACGSTNHFSEASEVLAVGLGTVRVITCPYNPRDQVKLLNRGDVPSWGRVLDLLHTAADKAGDVDA